MEIFKEIGFRALVVFIVLPFLFLKSLYFVIFTNQEVSVTIKDKENG